LCGLFSRDTLAFDADGNFVGVQDTAALNQGIGSYATWTFRRTQGEEIVQLYIHDMVSLPTRPVKELKDVARVALEPGETRTVMFSLTPDKLAAIGLDMKRRVPPGIYAVMVGKNSLEVLGDTLKVE
jgi:beta-glucosidase